MPPTQTSQTNWMGDDHLDRRRQEAIEHIRVEATYTPLLHAAVKRAIEKNSFKRLMCENRLYIHIANALKDENLPESERRPPTVSFLALEAMLPVQYHNKWNSVLNSLFHRCNTIQWIKTQLHTENSNAFAREIKAAHIFLDQHLSDKDHIQSRDKEQIIDRIEDAYWREKPQDHALVGPVMALVEKQEAVSHLDVLTVLAIHGGEYPPLLLKHLVYNQGSDYTQIGDLGKAAEQFEADPGLARHLEGAQAIIDRVKDMEKLATMLDELKDAKQAAQVRKRAEDLRGVSVPAQNLLRTVREGRVRKSVESPDRRRRRSSGSGSGSVPPIVTIADTPAVSIDATDSGRIAVKPSLSDSPPAWPLPSPPPAPPAGSA